MGNKILIISMASLALMISIVLMMKGESTKISNQFVESFNLTQAQYIANSGLNITLNKLRLNKNLRGNFPNNQLLGGVYDVSISGTDVVKITVNSNYMNKRGNAGVTTIWDNITLPPINFGMGISSSNINISLQGNILISGIDRNPDGTLGTAPAVSGITVEDIEDSVRVMSQIPENVRHKITGAGPTPSVSINPNSQNYTEIINQFIQSADIVLSSGTYTSGTTLGSPENPKITFVSGNARFAGNASGAGVLIVYGNMSCAGNFNYQGLVIVYGNAQISVTATGNTSIYGGMLVIGPNVDITATGSAIINYSSSTINNIQQKLKSSKFIVSNWIDW